MRHQKAWKEFGLITLSTVLIAVGIYFFKFTNHFTFGGVTGLAVVVARLTPISAGDFTFLANIVLLFVGFLFLGKGFTARTAYSCILLSFTISILERALPLSAPLTDEPLLELVFAIILPALGSAVLFNIQASSGGTDVIALLLKKYTSANIGTALLFSDAVVVFASFFVFDIRTGLFSCLGLAIKSFMIDTFIESINLCKYFNVVCSHPEPICDFIVNELNRSATVCDAKGAFSGRKKYIVLTVLNRAQAVRLRTYIKSLEPDAFILITNTSEIIGKGFHGI